MSRDGCVALPRGAMGFLGFVIVVFPDHTHLLFFYRYINGKKKKDGHGTPPLIIKEQKWCCLVRS